MKNGNYVHVTVQTKVKFKPNNREFHEQLTF